MKPIFDKLNKLSDSAILLIALILLTLSAISGYLIPSALFNEDSIYAALAAQDMLFKGKNILDWYISPAPYYFPDYLFYALSHILISNPFFRFPFIAVLQVLITFGALWYFAGKIVKQYSFALAVIITLLLVWTSLLTTDHFAHFFYAPIFSFMFVYAWHYGAFLSLLYYLVLWSAYGNPETSIRNDNVVMKGALYAGICILAFLSGASDKLFVLQAAIPLVATYIFIACVNKKFSWKTCALHIIAFLCAALGVYLHNTLHPNALRSEAILDFQAIMNHFTIRINGVWSQFYAMGLKLVHFGIFVCLYILTVFHAIYRLFCWEPKTKNENYLLFLTIFSFFSIIISLLLAATIGPSDIFDRYMMPLYLFPLIIPCFYFTYYLGKWLIIAGRILSFIMLLSLGYNVTVYIQNNGLILNQYKGILLEFDRNEIVCIDDVIKETGVKYGISNYWMSKPVMYYSKNDPIIASYHMDSYTPDHRLTSEAFYRDQYDFAIVPVVTTLQNGKPEAARNKLKLIAGNPALEKNCGLYTIMVYGKDQLSLNQKFLKPGSGDSWYGCNLGVFNGYGIADCVLELQNDADYKHMALAYLGKLSAGRYSFALSYSADKDAEEPAGDWDAIAFNPQIVFKKEPIYGSNGENKVLNGEFEVPPGIESNQFEFRIFVRPNVHFKVISVEVKRAE